MSAAIPVRRWTRRQASAAAYRDAFVAAARKAFDAGYILEEDLRRYTDRPPELPRLRSEGQGENPLDP